jgi:hypothetical protein
MGDRPTAAYHGKVFLVFIDDDGRFAVEPSSSSSSHSLRPVDEWAPRTGSVIDEAVGHLGELAGGDSGADGDDGWSATLAIARSMSR